MENNLQPIAITACLSCGEGNEKGARFCVRCGNRLSEGRKPLIKNRYFFLATIGLTFIGVIGFFWWGRFESKLVGKVNGEEITRKEFLKRVDLAKKLYEARYGQSLFEGQTGRENLNRIKTEILDEITTEKILLQQARSAGYTFPPREEIEKQIDAIKQKHRLSEAHLPKMFGESIADLKERLRNEWVISQFIEKVILKGDQTNPEQFFIRWLTNAKARARIETYEKWEPVSAAKASCCRSGCGGGRSRPLDPKIEKEAKAKGLEYYEKKTQKKGASATVTDFGCHIQVDIIDDGKVVVSLTYNGGEVQEI